MLVAHNVQKGEWACQVPFFPPHETAEVSYHSSVTTCFVFSLVQLVAREGSGVASGYVCAGGAA